MKSPELRKELSELTLHKRGIRINLQLPLIESEDEIQLRSNEDVFQRLIALTAIWQLQQASQRSDVIDVIHTQQLDSYFSENERRLMLENNADPAIPANAMSADALHFLAWCSGIQKAIGMPDGCYKEDVAELLWKQIVRNPDSLRSQIHLQSKTVLLDWADLLYRMHWAVRHAHITGKPIPGRLNAVAVHEWHKVVNWLIQYDDENDWDKVSTETAG
ncbi:MULTISPECIES: DUF4272 domain-containing protein [unclassified Undibacterium]|uniref:DUF4272 domain-containing protein n=1 Tax=unclassified Undibacterium TaxID=2630295 RepID=UPI003C2FCFD3